MAPPRSGIRTRPEAQEGAPSNPASTLAAQIRRPLARSRATRSPSRVATNTRPEAATGEVGSPPASKLQASFGAVGTRDRPTPLREASPRKIGQSAPAGA